MVFIVGEELTRQLVQNKWKDKDRFQLSQFVEEKIKEMWEDDLREYCEDMLALNTTPLLEGFNILGAETSLFPQNFRDMIIVEYPMTNAQTFKIFIDEPRLFEVFDTVGQNEISGQWLFTNRFVENLNEYMNNQVLTDYGNGGR